MSSHHSPLFTLICAIRSIGFYILFAGLCFLFFPLMLLTTLLPFALRLGVARLFCRCVISTAHWVCGIRYQILGQAHLTHSPVIFMSNHQSAWEVFGLFALLPPHVFVLKKELLWIPIFGWGLKLSRPIAIDRSKKQLALRHVLKQGKNRVAEGLSITIFPEGTRQKNNTLGTFNKGGAMLAHNNKIPVIPVAHNAGLYWPARSLIKYPGCVKVVIQPPIHSAQHTVEEINQLAYESIQGTMSKIMLKVE